MAVLRWHGLDRLHASATDSADGSVCNVNVSGDIHAAAHGRKSESMVVGWGHVAGGICRINFFGLERQSLALGDLTRVARS